MSKRIYILLLLFLNTFGVFAQYPLHFTYDTENKLPSNEVYSIVQDPKGFIWIGCDAGLFKFDGVRYISYKSNTQKSKSVTGLTISSSGKIYCYNFQSHVFQLDNNSLIELKHIPSDIIINNLVSDEHGNIYVMYTGGILHYNEQQNQWEDFFQYSLDDVFSNYNWVAKSVKGSLRKNIAFIYSKGIAEVNSSAGSPTGIKQVFQTNLFQPVSPGKFELENYENALWIFSKENEIIYRYADNKIKQITNKKLNELLKGRKINTVKLLSDNNLWICTYKGIVRFNQKNNTADLFYPELSFSDCIIDRENNYWFSTFQTGVLRVPNLNYTVWNKENKSLKNDRLVKIATDSTHIYFASVNGMISEINTLTDQLKTFYTGSDADIQSFDYDFKERSLYFNINNRLHKLNNNLLSKTESNVYAIKSYHKLNKHLFILSSHGVYINEIKVNNSWARELKYNPQAQTVWIATNNGLQQYIHKNNEWDLARVLINEAQILSIDFDEKTQQIFALTFDGNIYSISETNHTTLTARLPETVQANKLKQQQNKLYLATNKGVWIYDLLKKQWNSINALSGLASENVQDLVILNNALWLATGKGLQKIPLNENPEKPLAKIYLKNTNSFTINYSEALILNPEASIYSSNGKFEYAYRVNHQEWIKLPANIEQIEIRNLPARNIEIELKVIDHLGRNSENTVMLKGYVNPPFWQTWWFVLLIAVLLSGLIFFIFKMRIKRLKQKQQQEIERIQLENDLRLSRETALKSQMNPHFVFNVMNTIKASIYKNDKHNASDYLNRFSDLIRMFLSMSSKPIIAIADEIKMLEQYISMEAMMLGNDFSFRKNIDETIDLQQTKIPSLIIQPFIENAFKHGLHNKTGKKELTFSICKTDANHITIEITDNGIGRQAAQKIKEAEKPGHQSFATTAIEKRIALLNRNQQTVSVTINDLFDEHNQPSGTTVLVKINYE